MLTYKTPTFHIHNLGILSIYYDNMTPLIMAYTSMEMVYVNMDSGIYLNVKWHMPKWIVAYTTMQSGICQNG
jgi:hypothetical protein